MYFFFYLGENGVDGKNGRDGSDGMNDKDGTNGVACPAGKTKSLFLILFIDFYSLSLLCLRACWIQWDGRQGREKWPTRKRRTSRFL